MVSRAEVTGLVGNSCDTRNVRCGIGRAAVVVVVVRRPTVCGDEWRGGGGGVVQKNTKIVGERIET